MRISSPDDPAGARRAGVLAQVEAVRAALAHLAAWERLPAVERQASKPPAIRRASLEQLHRRLIAELARLDQAVPQAGSAG